MWRGRGSAVLVVMCAVATAARAQEAVAPGAMDVLSPRQAQQMDQGVERALAWLAAQQRTDGAFVSTEPAQPAVTSLCLLAYLSGGHLPGKGLYGQKLTAAIDFILATQRDDGIFSFGEPRETDAHREPGQTAIYNHAIAGLALT